MTDSIVSGFSGTDEPFEMPSEAIIQGTLLIEFVSAGDLDVKASPDGTTVIDDADTFSSDTWTNYAPLPDHLVLDARNGAEVNVWVVRGHVVGTAQA